jgi:hypothetical protein
MTTAIIIAQAQTIQSSVEIENFGIEYSCEEQSVKSPGQDNGSDNRAAT